MNHSSAVLVGDLESKLGSVDIDGRQVWYFGNDYARYQQLRASLKGAEFFPVGEAINEVAGQIAPDLIELDAHAACGRAAISWLASEIAARNPYTSPLCLELCRSIALVDAARRGGHHLVLVDDPRFGRVLAALCRDNGISARWSGATARRGRYLSAARAHGAFLRSWLRQRRAIKRSPCATAGLRAKHPWLMSWAEVQIANGGDRFLGTLAGWLRQSDFKIGALYNPVDWVFSIEAIAAAVEQLSRVEAAVLVGQFLGPADLVRAYARLLTFPAAIKRRLSVAGVDVTRVLRQAVHRELASPRLVAAALYENLARSLARQDLIPSALFYTYENQPWEKVMLAGFRRALPRTILIGVQHAPLAERYLSGHPSRRQWHDGTAPDLLVSMGAAFKERLVALGAPAERVVVGGALRQVDFPSEPRTSGRHRDDEKLVLATCSMDPHDSLELAHKAIMATTDIPGVRLIVNFHPMIEGDIRTAMRTRLTGLIDCRHVEFDDGSAAQWLQRVHVLLHGASGTGLEAAMAGVPSVFVGSDIMLDADKMSDALTPKCRRPDDLRRQIVALLNDVDARRAAVEAGRAWFARNVSPSNAGFWTALAQQAAAGRAA